MASKLHEMPSVERVAPSGGPAGRRRRPGGAERTPPPLPAAETGAPTGTNREGVILTSRGFPLYL